MIFRNHFSDYLLSDTAGTFQRSMKFEFPIVV